MYQHAGTRSLNLHNILYHSKGQIQTRAGSLAIVDGHYDLPTAFIWFKHISFRRKGLGAAYVTMPSLESIYLCMYGLAFICVCMG